VGTGTSFKDKHKKLHGRKTFLFLRRGHRTGTQVTYLAAFPSCEILLLAPPKFHPVEKMNQEKTDAAILAKFRNLFFLLVKFTVASWKNI